MIVFGGRGEVTIVLVSVTGLAWKLKRRVGMVVVGRS